MLPTEKNPDSQILAPYFKLLGTAHSLYTYLLVLLEGMFIVGSFSYVGSYISKVYHFNFLIIGLIMTGFGIMTVIGGRISGKVAQRVGSRKILSLGLCTAALADLVIYYRGKNLVFIIIGVALMGLGFIFTHSTLLTRATEFAQKARGSAMSLVAFFFMGSGGVGTAIGGRLISRYGFDRLFGVFRVALIITLLLSYFLIQYQSLKANELAKTAK